VDRASLFTLPVDDVIALIEAQAQQIATLTARVSELSAPAPEGFEPGSPFGPGIEAVIIHLNITQAVSFERLSNLMSELFGLSISERAIANILKRAQTSLVAAADSRGGAREPGRGLRRDLSACGRQDLVAVGAAEHDCNLPYFRRHLRRLGRDDLPQRRQVSSVLACRIGAC
jgi:hypothetical protein